MAHAADQTVQRGYASADKSTYVAAKYGVVGLTKVAAIELANDGITVNAICPGWVLTPLVRKQIDERAKHEGKTAEAVTHDFLAEKQPMIQFSTPEEVDTLAGLPVFRQCRYDYRGADLDRRRLGRAIEAIPLPPTALSSGRRQRTDDDMRLFHCGNEVYGRPRSCAVTDREIIARARRGQHSRPPRDGGHRHGILVVAALWLAEAVFAPLTFALFIIAIVWPLQARLQARLPKLVALAISMLATILVIGAFAWVITWGFSRVGRYIITDAARFQLLYNQMTEWLEDMDRGREPLGRAFQRRLGARYSRRSPPG